MPSERTSSPAYRSWTCMRSRCNRPSAVQYPHYGGRGITVCERWMTFENFLADMGARPAGTTLDRIDTDGNYEPGNCRWATQKTQMRNTRSTLFVEFEGERVSLRELCERRAISYKLVWGRMKHGATLEDALRPEQRKRGVPNTSGYVGVGRNKGRWVASICRDGQQIYLGVRNCPAEAYALVLAAKASA